MSGLLLGYKFGFCENKQKNLAQRSKGATMTTRWTRRVNQAQGRKEKDIGSFKLSLDRGINSARKFSCTRNAVWVHVRNHASNL